MALGRLIAIEAVNKLERTGNDTEEEEMHEDGTRECGNLETRRRKQ